MEALICSAGGDGTALVTALATAQQPRSCGGEFCENCMGVITIDSSNVTRSVGRTFVCLYLVVQGAGSVLIAWLSGVMRAMLVCLCRVYVIALSAAAHCGLVGDQLALLQSTIVVLQTSCVHLRFKHILTMMHFCHLLSRTAQSVMAARAPQLEQACWRHRRRRQDDTCT